MASAGELVLAIKNFYIARFTSGAAVTLVLYDCLLVFNREFEIIYSAKWTVPKFLFLFIRVITPPSVILGTMQRVDFRPAMSTERCTVSLFYLIYAMLTSLLAAHGLFTFRLVALYKNKKYMVWFIITFYVATYICTYGLIIGATITLNGFTTFYSPALKSCVTLGASPLLPPIWYAPVAYETFIFSLTVYRAWRDSKVISGQTAPFLVLFYRDGFIAFVVMTGARIWNIWIYLAQPASSVYIGTMLLWALNSVLTTRVYTNLVWLAHKPAAVTGMYTGASIGFSSRSYGTSGAGSTTVEMMPTLHRERIVEENGIGKGKRKSDE